MAALHRSLVATAAFTGMLLVCCPSASALDPALDVSQYAHTAWKIRDGFTKGVIKCIAQTPDGYLWLGTEFGLLRFDGVRTTEWRPPVDQPLPSSDIWSLLATHDGALWIGTAKGLARWKGGSLTHYPELAGRIVWRLLEDHENTIWASGSAATSGRLCAIGDRDVKCDGDDGRFGYGVLALREDRKGNLWLGVSGGIWRWRPGPPVFFPLSGQADMAGAFDEDADGQLLVTTDRGIRRFVAGETNAYPLGGPAAPIRALDLLRDRHGALWIGTAKGVVHAYEGRLDTFAQVDGLSGDAVLGLFEDREGSIWVSTANGLDRFRALVVSALSERQGLSNAQAFSVAAAPDGSVWLGTRDSLEKLQDGGVTSYRAHARSGVASTTRQVVGNGFPGAALGVLLADSRSRVWTATTASFGYFDRDRAHYVGVPAVAVRAVRSMAEDTDGNLWIADQQAGLVRLSSSGRVDQTPWAALGHKDFATSIAADVVRGGLWLGFWDGGVSLLQNGAVRDTYQPGQGLGKGHVSNLRLDADGALWVATAGGLSHVRNGHAATLTAANGLPCDVVHWAVADEDRSLWLNSECGLIRVARADVDAWVANPEHVVKALLFDGSDGARLEALPTGYDPFVAKSSDGKLWFVSFDGVEIVDPRHLPFNTIPPPVHIEQIVADHRTVDVRSGDQSRISLPPRTRDVQIDYTALSLAAPEKVLFRYQLEGVDDAWQTVGTRRQAFYNNLAPGNYRFRVIASNNSGVWNESGDSLDFSIAPAYYQTSWFLALSVASVVALVWTAHRVRLRIVERHQREISALNERMMKTQEQERIRIAGELHDGVMQEMLAATMILGTTKRRISDNPDAAKAAIDKVQQKLIQAGTDLRQLSHDLHPPLLQEAGLPKAVQSYCEEFGTASTIPVSCEVDETASELSRGSALALFRILQEALGNAAKHATASRITVRLTRQNGLVTLVIADNGVGLDRAQLAAGGGLGLIMMRERATQLNGTLDVESAPGRGTTIKVTIPFR